MDIPYVKGQVAKQAHVGVPQGTFEEEFARNGFSGRYAHLYRTRPMVEWTSIEGPLRPRAFDLGKLAVAAPSDFLESRKSCLENEDVAISYFTLAEEMPYFFRNADADEILFIHSGHGRIETDFGPLAYERGDYLVVPRGTVYRLCPARDEPGTAGATHALLIESAGEVRFPEKGPLGQHALVDPAVIRVPSPPSPDLASGGAPSEGRYELRVKRGGEITRITYPFHPLNAVGWKGTLTVWQLNVRDIRPVLSDRYHLPPTAHATFAGEGFVVCTFLPRPLENGDPEAMKVPFHHLNIDFDEVIFYHRGEFFSRSGIREGMMTFHPAGIPHGPQKKAVERSREKTRTDEVAVMIDTRKPLRPTEASKAIESGEYWKSWS